MRTIARWGVAAIFSLQPVNLAVSPALGPASATCQCGKDLAERFPAPLTSRKNTNWGHDAASGPHSVKGRRLGRFRVTFYWLVEEDKYAGDRTAPLYTLRGELLGYFPARFVRDFRMESCALLREGRMISDPRAGNRCRVVGAPIGCHGFTLSALQSVAVDPTIVPIGAELYIPAANGVSLGGDACHDGLFYAHDVGGLIKGKRIDIYVGPRSNLELFESTSLCRSGRAEVYLDPD